jgi:hypothetical protein
VIEREIERKGFVHREKRIETAIFSNGASHFRETPCITFKPNGERKRERDKD